MKTNSCYVDWGSLELVVNGPYEYRIDLERCNTPAQLLDYILQVAGKDWCDGNLLKLLIDCLEDASERKFEMNLQGAICPGGVPWEVNWKTGARQPMNDV